MGYRSPGALDESIRQHQITFREEPKLIMLHERFVAAYSFYFRGRLHTLCCGKGALYSGIPAIVTASAMVTDFLICY
jgi:hypothetical protein